LSLKSEGEERFLRSGTANNAVPPVPSTSLRAGEMTDFGCWMMWEKSNFGEVEFSQDNRLKQIKPELTFWRSAG